MKTTSVGERNKRIRVYKTAKVSDGQGGYRKGKPALLATVWAMIHPAKFWTGNAGGGPISGVTQGITTKTLAGLDESCTVTYKNQTYEILNLDYSVDGEVTMTCKAVVHRG